MIFTGGDVADVAGGAAADVVGGTIANFADLLSSSGWKLQEVRKNPGNKMWWPMIVAVPA